jgi:YD repeat-containing protein
MVITFPEASDFPALQRIPLDEYLTNIYVGDMYAYVTPLKLTSVVETTDGVTRTTEYEYDDHYQIRQARTASSSGGSLIERRYYPYDYSGSPYGKMVTQNRISDVVRTEQYRTDTLPSSEIARKETSYHDWTYYIHPDTTTISYLRAAAFVDSQVKQYDPKGNPVEIVERGRNVVYLWSHGYRHVVAEIRNATWAEVSRSVNLSTLGRLGYSPSHNSSRNSMLNSLKNNLPAGALMTTFEYSPFGMTRQTDPSGRFQTYTYDSHGRLYQILDEDGNVLEQYDYHYATH